MNLNFETDGLNFNNKGKPDEIATPIHICRDMSNLFDYTNCNQKIWMDIFCKTGNTLEALKENGVSKNNIAAVCNNKQSQMLACRKLYGKLLPEIEVEITVKSLEAYKITRRGQVYWVSNWQDIVKNHYQDAYNIIKFVILKEMEKTMQLEWNSDKEFQINNIIMNPPYNKGIDMDFNFLAFTLAQDAFVVIQPGKCFSSDREQKIVSKHTYGDFRDKIVPYIEEVVFYPDCRNIFKIDQADGIVYFICNKHKDLSNDTTTVVNKCKHGKFFNDTEVRSILHGEMLNNTANRIVNNIIERVGKYEPYTFKHIDTYKKYVVVANNQIVVGKTERSTLYSSDDNLLVVGVADIQESSSIVASSSSNILFTSDNLDECKSYLSWLNCKFTRFFVGTYISKMTGIFNDNNWRFVPDPGKFDHIFTDEELYKKYDLTPDEIAIIESVIKERK